MTTTSTTLSNKERLEKAWQAFEAVQQLQEDRLAWGINHVNLYVENVDGDWLENWGEDEEEELSEKLVMIKDSGSRGVENQKNNCTS